MTSRRVDCTFILVFLLFLCYSSQGLVSDGEALLKFKANVMDEGNVLSTWGFSGQDPCNARVLTNCSFCEPGRMDSSWFGVLCFNVAGAGWAVSDVFLGGSSLVSNDVSALSRLTNLQKLSMGGNIFSGPLPDIENMANLTDLILYDNRFNGPLPQHFPPSLRNIDLRNNSLRGDVRDTNLFTLQSLETLDLGGNGLSGDVSAPNFFNLPMLSRLDLSKNNLTGKFPDMSGLQNLTDLDISQNGFEGPLPAGITNLSLSFCNMSVNRFSGSIEIDQVYASAWSYTKLDLSRNLLNGSISSFLSLASGTGISHLDLSYNYLEGPVPKNLTAELEYVYLSSNRLTSEDLADILTGNFSFLLELHLADNNVQGDASIFSAVNNTCPTLQVLDLRNCGLSGSIDTFANQTMPWLNILDLSGNSLEGPLSMPRMFEGKPKLQDLRLQNNSYLTGEQEAGSLANITSLAVLEVLDLSSNQLKFETSWIEQVLKIPSLKRLDISNGNQVIPSVLPNLTSLKITASARSLEFLGLSNLQLTGSIPPLFIVRDYFPSLKILDLSNNSLQGSLPNWFWYVQGLDVIISGNDFSAKLPSIPSVLLNTQPFLGNDGLCLTGPLPTYRENGTVDTSIYTRECFSPQRLGWEVWKISLVAAVCGVVLGCTCLLLGAIWRRRVEAKQHKQDAELIALLLERDSTTLMPLRDLKKATNDFSEENQIGAGGFGTVYRGVLVDGSVVAIKKSHHVGTSSEEKYQFLNEVKILSQVHHRYLVRLLGCCLAHNNALLVFEFVSNGTLQEHLNRKDDWAPLSWSQRLLIAKQTAEALDYLHSSANPPIYHLDVKSANILLDSHLNSKVADFGLSRLAPAPDVTHISTLPGLKGTFGYMDPELALRSQLTGKSDVYAFGAVLLELITAKAVVDRSRGEDISLIKWVGSLIEKGRLIEAMDPTILDTFSTQGGRQSIDAVAELAVQCLSFRSEHRPSMKLVSSRLLNIEELLLGQNSRQPIESSGSWNIEMVDLDRDTSSSTEI